MSSLPRIVVAGLSGGTGKTIVSLGLAHAWSRRGLDVRPFKKGPDYIDAAWLGHAAGKNCTNLDPYFLSPDTVRALFHVRAAECDMAVIEGNRGLFDGKDEHGSCSTSELARQLDAPVILAIDCTKMTRTVAAIVQGCTAFEPGLRLAGVICNRTAGERHRSVLRKSIETHTDIPVLGMLPKMENPIPERHMGLVPDQEYAAESYTGYAQALDSIAHVAEDWLDMDAIFAAGVAAPKLAPPSVSLWSTEPAPKGVRIGYVHDDAFWFYYQENLEALEHAGAELVRLSLLDDEPWPDIHGLYIGGGFPETWAARLAANADKRAKVRELSRAGMPIYAECGGFMYLCEFLEYQGERYPMSGVFPVSTSFCVRPQGLGYTEATVAAENPFYAVGEKLCGHEFHYSRCVSDDPQGLSFALKMDRGKGMHDGRDGLIRDNTYAGYNHIHALAVPGWAPAFVQAAQRFGKG